MHSENVNKISLLLYILILSVAIAWLYSPVARYNFINYDDYEYVVDNHNVNRGITSDGIKWAFLSSYVSNWHPVTWLSHMLDCHLYGLDPGKHHVTSLAFHILNSILLFFVFFRATDQIWPCAFLGAFFAFHPMHVESVAWVAERKDVLNTFFMMITFLFYISYVESRRKVTYMASLFFFIAGLMSKPMIITLPFLLLLFDYWPLRRLTFHENKPDGILKIGDKALTGDVKYCLCEEPNRFSIFKISANLIFEKLPFFVLSGVSGYITLIAQNKGGAIVPITIYPLRIRVFNASISYFEYVRKLFYPIDLAVPYPYPDEFSWLLLLLSTLFLLLSTFVVLIKIKSNPYIFVGWFWYLGTLIPVIGLVQVGAQAMADRYTYIPYTGIFIIIFWYLNGLLKGKKKLQIVTVIGLLSVLVGMVFLTNTQIRKWSDSITLFSNSLRVTNNNYIAHSNLGQAIIGRKDIPLEKAAEHFGEAVRIKPDFAIAYLNLGVYWSSVGEDEKALGSYRKALEYEPDDVVALTNIGNIHFKRAQFDMALEKYFEAIRVNSACHQAYSGIGAVYAKKGDFEKAKLFMVKALEINPDNADAKANLSSIIRAEEKNNKD